MLLCLRELSIFLGSLLCRLVCLLLYGRRLQMRRTLKELLPN